MHWKTLEITLKAANMAKKKDVGDMASVLAMLEESRREEKRKALKRAGIEFALLLAWMDDSGASVAGDKSSLLETFMDDSPDLAKGALELYEALRKKPSLAGLLMKGAVINMVDGKLQTHFKWKEFDAERLVEAIRKESAKTA